MIYVTGANGRIGRVVLEKVKGIAIVRRSCGLPNEIVTSYEVEDLRRIFKDARAVLHIAGSVKFKDRKSLWKGNVELTEKVVNAVPDDAKIVFASSIAVYGSNPPYMANEETPINPDNYYAKTKALAEEIVSSHRKHVILRIGTVYGIQFNEYIKMISLISKGIVPIVGSGDNRIPFVHVEDVAQCFLNALKEDIQGVYIVCGKPEKLRDIMIFTAKLLRRRFFILRIPKSLAKALAKPLSLEEHVKVLTSDRVFDIRKAMKYLGFNPRDIWGGIREVVDYWRRLNEREGGEIHLGKRS
ncbi:NAD-dependent epimerase/dehydratase family protein [Archaeoglobus profundus]|uniref:NAD-dependent epimerase/dehydratase n=1 Tax=Archaeoglobus profundus (strain DSM 5631 / JCM 9629 / NBRC 100127 / Av18) TaxID=572546 RepID=D2RD56_ARCPA|nr:NAD-dependent epimerase/dehydratase family protein [Archaeoglobus profundus]ADB58050.1 NAD-dependent epimerase/dehydratase [Archaeoglobus profundus DSM 5631]